MATLAKNFPIFKRRKSKNADLHVKSFEHYWNVARTRDLNLAAEAMDGLKKDEFLNTFKKKATEWISRYEDDHFQNHAQLTAAFLQRFWKEKLSSQLCDRIRELKQKDMDVEAYAR